MLTMVASGSTILSPSGTDFAKVRDWVQTSKFAVELYAAQGRRNPIEVAREEWGT